MNLFFFDEIVHHDNVFGSLFLLGIYNPTQLCEGHMLFVNEKQIFQKISLIDTIHFPYF